MAHKLAEYTYGDHAYMRLILDSGRIEEIDVFFREDETIYKTSADYCPENHPAGLRAQIISAFKALY